jgi:hypothetical protein
LKLLLHDAPLCLACVQVMRIVGCPTAASYGGRESAVARAAAAASEWPWAHRGAAAAAGGGIAAGSNCSDEEGLCDGDNGGSGV